MFFEIIGDPILVLWAAYLLLVPIYVTVSGLPQPGDMLVLLLVPIALTRWDGRLPGHQRDVLRTLLMFCAWAIVVNFAWSVMGNTWTINLKYGFLLSPFFYIYNALVFLTAMKELPTTILLAPTGFDTLAVRIWSATSEGFFARAAGPALLMMLVAALSLGFVLRGERTR